LFYQPKIGLALGGGGARGFAHIGVLQILEREKVPVHLITGSSAGALVGSLYAFHPDAALVEKKVRSYIASPEFKKLGISHVAKKKASDNTLFSQVATYLKERIIINLAHSRTSLLNNKRLFSSYATLLDRQDIKKSVIELGVVAADLISGRDILFTSGDLIRAVTASSSLPGFLPPMKYMNYLLLDGCVTQPVPVSAAHSMGAQVVIAVDVSQDVPPQHEYDNILEIMARTNLMTSQTLNMVQLEKADIVLKPAVGMHHWSDFDNLDDFIQQGQKAALAAIPHIKKLTRRRFTKISHR